METEVIVQKDNSFSDTIGGDIKKDIILMRKYFLFEPERWKDFEEKQGENEAKKQFVVKSSKLAQLEQPTTNHLKLWEVCLSQLTYS